MAKRRCISVDVYDSEEYFNLSDRAKVLYTQFILKSDDEGVVINPTTAMRLCCAEKEILQELLDSGFVLEIDGIYVVRHWHVHNQIPPTKKTASVYQEELSLLIIDEKKRYAISGRKNAEKFLHNISKDNIIQDNKSKVNIAEDNSAQVSKRQREQSPAPFTSSLRTSENMDVSTVEFDTVLRDTEAFLKELKISKATNKQKNTA